ncbi:hypothetical protein L9F63_001064 [Diploptera punctata]|uniref:Uncharacterized protein n=1 Tax=Diploptera punctata TaxID=6984 RepID=A0AAD8AKL4_DIPPU|nr:hypothetical protein L9F63_001064 [Diploptera punctata]
MVFPLPQGERAWCCSDYGKKVDIYVEDDWPLRRSYRLEDFLWSGSGDGQDGNDHDPGGGKSGSSWRTTTIVHTTTILTTVFPTPLYTTTYVQEHSQHTPLPCSSSGLCISEVSPSWSGPSQYVPSESIEPTPTLVQPSPTVRPTWSPPAQNQNSTRSLPDQKFWLITVIEVDPQSLPSVNTLEEKLAKLYMKAFYLQQQRHLGIGNSTSSVEQMRARKTREHKVPEAVNVYVHNKTSIADDKLELLYTVHVSGKPVLAYTAAEDMKLVSNKYFSDTLGYNIITKAKPYLDDPMPSDARRRQGHSRDAWLLIGAAIAAVCLLLLIIVLIALGLSKRKRNKRRVIATTRQSNIQREFEREGGSTNLAFQDETDTKGHGRSGSTVWPPGSKTSPGFMPVAPTSSVTFKDDIVSERKRTGSSTSISSGESSATSLVRRRPGNGRKGTRAKIREVRQQDSDREDEVPTVREYPQPQPRKRQQIPVKQPRRAYSDGGAETPILNPQESRKNMDSNDDFPGKDRSSVKPRVGTAISPNSFLSMPSIKAFPRGANIPEPLARVLEPVTVRHLDSEGRGIIVEPIRRLARHGSMEGEDPGVIGPLVWDLHCHRVQCQQQHEDATNSNVGRMRRRFHELLDDAFSLFGSRSGSPGAEEDSSSPPTLHRVHSAIVRPVGEPLLVPSETIPRPRTSDPRRPATAAPTVARPRGAWGTCNPSPHSGRLGTLPRPLSAGPFHRPQLPGPVEITIDRTLILSDNQLPPTDPAIPLIAAIKEELRKFQGTNVHPAISLPGSTTSKP